MSSIFQPIFLFSILILPQIFSKLDLMWTWDRLWTFNPLSIASCSGFNENGPICLCLAPLVELFGKDQWLQPCWWRCVTGDRLCGLNSPPHTQSAISLLLMVQDISSKLLLQHHACLPVAVFTPWWSWLHPPKPYAPNKFFCKFSDFYKTWAWCLITVIEKKLRYQHAPPGWTNNGYCCLEPLLK